MTLPLQPSKLPTKSPSNLEYPSQLQIDPLSQAGGLPTLSGEMPTTPQHAMMLVLRVHNRAGIPILEAHSQLAPGQRQFTFSDLRPVGIEAYAHKSVAEQQTIAARIWSRRAYGTLSTLEAA